MPWQCRSVTLQECLRTHGWHTFFWDRIQKIMAMRLSHPFRHKISLSWLRYYDRVSLIKVADGWILFELRLLSAHRWSSFNVIPIKSSLFAPERWGRKYFDIFAKRKTLKSWSNTKVRFHGSLWCADKTCWVIARGKISFNRVGGSRQI